MKILRFLFLAGFLAFASGCTEDVLSPHTDGDGSEDPIVVGDPNDSTSTGG